MLLTRKMAISCNKKKWKQCQILYLGDFTQTKFHLYVQLEGYIYICPFDQTIAVYRLTRLSCLHQDNPHAAS